MTFPRRLQIFGVALVFVGLLTSPLKPYVFRCGMKPVDLLEGQCTAFKEWHSPIGYIPLALGIVAIAFRIVLKIRESTE